MSPQSNESSLLAEPNMPCMSSHNPKSASWLKSHPSASFRRPGEDMLNALARPESLDSALRNAAGLNEEQFKMLKVGHRGNHWIEA
jgi:hypothetical protein